MADTKLVRLSRNASILADQEIHMPDKQFVKYRGISSVVVADMRSSVRTPYDKTALPKAEGTMSGQFPCQIAAFQNEIDQYSRLGEQYQPNWRGRAGYLNRESGRVVIHSQTAVSCGASSSGDPELSIT